MITENFIFDGEDLASRGYLIATSQGTEQEIPASEMTYENIQAPRSDIRRIIGTRYENPYTRTFGIIKNPCYGDKEDYALTNDDISEMTKWLCRKTYKWFRWIDEDDLTDEVWHEVKFNVSNEEYGGKVIGLTLTVETNRPYGLTRSIKNKWNTTNETKHMVIVKSDEEGYIYPNVTITVQQGGDISFTNLFDGRKTEIKNCTANEVITIHGSDVLQIDSSNEDHDLSEDFNYVFPRLVSTYETNSNNVFTAEGGAEVLFEYRGIRKVGI